jgi:hypothetical protein
MMNSGGQLMGRFKSLLTLSTAAVVLTGGIAAGQGVLPDRATIVTISAPVSVAGTVLPAGEYLFRLADTQASRNVVQIFDRDRTKIFATVIGISALRDQPEGESVVTFHETPSDRPPAVRYWFYAGERAGQEFVYPKEQAMAIARASGEPVMAMDTASTDPEAMQKAELSRVDANSPEVAAAAPARSPAEPAAAAPAEPRPPIETPETASQAEPGAATPPAAPPQARAQEPATQPRTTPATEPRPVGTSGSTMAAPAGSGRELPRTASSMPLAGIFGMMAICAAVALRAYRRRLGM